LPAHQVTTRNLGAAYPFIAEAGLGQRGVVIGDDLLGGSFVFDPFELYAAGVVSNPNMVGIAQGRSFVAECLSYGNPTIEGFAEDRSIRLPRTEPRTRGQRPLWDADFLQFNSCQEVSPSKSNHTSWLSGPEEW
jgi:hypothetical protein